MNGQEILDGFNHIDEQYIAEAEDTGLIAPSRGIWLRLAALAACVCLIATVLLWDPIAYGSAGDQLPGGTNPGSGLLTEEYETYLDGDPHGEGPDEVCSPLEPANYAVSARYLRIGEQNGETEYPVTELITSRAELERYCAGLDEYGDSYFTDNNLLMITLEEPSGSIRHQVVGFWLDPETAEWTVTVERSVPAECTDDMALWQILISVQMGAVVQEGDGIHVQFVTKIEEG